MYDEYLEDKMTDQDDIVSEVHNVQKNSILKPAVFKPFPDLSLFGANLYEIYRRFGVDGRLEYKSDSGNKITVDGKIDIVSLKRTNIFFQGKGNNIILNNLKGVCGLDIACTLGSTVQISSPATVRGMSILSTHGCVVKIEEDCMISSDILIYSSKAHGLYNVSDGARRYKETVEIGRHVWLGRGAKILAGAKVGDGSVIGSYSVLAGKIANNCAAAGNPCRVVTKNIFWTTATAKGDGNYFDALKKQGLAKPYYINPTED